MWHEQAIWEWSWHVISIVACCHSVKLCAIAARGFPLLLAHMSFGTWCNLWVWRRRINRRPCRSRMSNPSTSSLIARHDSPLWWHNWMAAQLLPRNLVRPGNGYNWFKRRRSQKLAKVIRSQFISQKNWFRTFRRQMQNWFPLWNKLWSNYFRCFCGLHLRIIKCRFRISFKLQRNGLLWPAVNSCWSIWSFELCVLCRSFLNLCCE